MALLIGLYAPGDPESAQRAWQTLSADRGEPVSASARIYESPLHAAIFGHHRGDRAIVPAGNAGMQSIGFGGNATSDSSALAPPWLRCSYDAVQRSVTVTPDRYGFALLYYRRIGAITAFSSSALVLARLAPELPRDPSAIAEQTAFGHLLGVRLPRIGIELLPVGSELVITPDGVTTPKRFEYSHIALAPDADRGAFARELVPAWHTAISTASAARESSEPLIIPLSGGLDSRLIAAAASERGEPIEAFTFGREPGTHAPAADVQIAQRVAKTLGIEWQFLPLAADWIATYARSAIELTDGQCDVLHTSAINAQRACRSGGVLLDGIGGDVILGGLAYKDELLRATTRPARLRAMWRLRTRIDSPAWKGLLLPSARSELRARVNASFEASLDAVHADLGTSDPRWADVWTLRNRTRRFINNGQLLWLTCARPAFPFFAPAFFDRMLMTQPKLRAEGRLQAALFYAGWPAMAGIPWQKSGRPIARPGGLGAWLQRLRPRAFPAFQPFFDFDAAFRESERLREFLRDQVLDSTGIERFGCFDHAVIERLFEDTQHGREQGTSRLTFLASLVLADRAWSTSPRS